MAPKREIFFNFIGDSSKLERAAGIAGGSLDKVGTKTDRLAAKMNKFGKGLTAGVTLPVVAAFGVGFKSLIENEALLAQTQAVIDSTGAAANVTGDEVLGLANDLSDLSGAAHENIVEGANMLLTFKNIRNEVGEGNDVFDQSTKTLLDMSIATGQDMQSAAVQLGKALNDPIAGVAALNRVGVQFTDEQKEQIKVLQESGDVMGAQKIILAELEGQFGGSAEAAGDTMAGSINRLKNSFEEIARSLALFLVPILGALAGILSSVTSWFNNLSPGVKSLVGPLLGVAAAVGPLLLAGAAMIRMWKKVKVAFLLLQTTMAANPFILLAAAIVALVILVVLNWDKIKETLLKVWEAIKSAASTTWDFIKGAVETAINFVTDLFLNFTGPGLLIKHWDKIREGIQGVVNFFTEKWDETVDFFTKLPGRIFKTASDIWDEVYIQIDTVIQYFKDEWDGFVEFFTELPGKLFETAEDIWDEVYIQIDTVIQYFKDEWGGIVTFFTELPGKITTAAVGMWDGITAAFKSAINTIIRAWNRLELKIGGQRVPLPFGRSFNIASVTLSTPNIEELHTGGIFRAPRPGGEGLALLKDRERVTPADRIEPFGDETGRGLVIQLIVDGKVLAESLISHEAALA